MKHILSSLILLGLGCASLTAQEVDALNASIRQNRMGTLVITAKPGSKVQIEQTRHEFWFGAAIASGAFNGEMPAVDAARYKSVFLQNFNSAVMENALKWLSMEPERGAVDYKTVDAILAWADKGGLPMRGHNIYWGTAHWVQPWLKALDDASFRGALQARGEDIARRYRGRFVEYDFNNEMIHGNYYEDRLGPDVTRDMAGWVLAQDPEAKLYVNDYDILTGRRLADYIAHIRHLRESGVPIAGIGVQGHLHGDTFDPAALQGALDELARLGLPIRVTEFNFPGQRSRFYKHPELAMTPEEEEAKARALVDYYRICFAHPGVTGILMWGFWAGDNWIPQSSLYRRDWSPTPAAVAYHDLVFKEWWTRARIKVDKSGRAELPAFFGSYRISSGKKSVILELRRAEGTATAALR